MTDNNYSESGRISLAIEEAHQKGELTHPKHEYFANASFSGILLQAVLQSKAGNHMNQNVVWMDVYHNTDAETVNQFNFTAAVANTTTWSEEKVAEIYEETIYQVHETLYDLFSQGSILMDGEPCSQEESYDTLLLDLADDLVYYKFVWEVFHGGRVEKLVGNQLADYWGVDEWIATTPELEAHGIEHPEPRGIDLYFPELDVTVQVKQGDGGRPRNCEADIIARYDQEEPDITFKPL